MTQESPLTILTNLFTAVGQQRIQQGAAIMRTSGMDIRKTSTLIKEMSITRPGFNRVQKAVGNISQ